MLKYYHFFLSFLRLVNFSKAADRWSIRWHRQKTCCRLWKCEMWPRHSGKFCLSGNLLLHHGMLNLLLTRPQWRSKTARVQKTFKSFKKVSSPSKNFQVIRKSFKTFDKVSRHLTKSQVLQIVSRHLTKLFHGPNWMKLWHKLKYSKVFQSILKYFKEFQSISKYSKTFQTIPKYFKIFQSIPKYSKSLQNTPKYSKAF